MLQTFNCVDRSRCSGAATLRMQHVLHLDLIRRTKYVGQWISNQRHGQGRMQYSNGDAYEGLWIKDHRNGLAKYFYANGDVFIGRYEHNRREGLGTIYMVNMI